MRRPNLQPAILATAVMMATGAALAQSAAPQFKFSELPPPDTTTPVAPSIYDAFATSDTSPLGTPAAAVKPADLFDKAATFVPGPNGRSSNPSEAAFWLKRAILIAPDDTGKRRAWAVMTLGLLAYETGDPAGHAAARSLWEMAGAWNNAIALCDLGQLAEFGDDVAAADPKKAVMWYERAKKAGCAQADDALSRLKR